jgi:hypothetical protein
MSLSAPGMVGAATSSWLLERRKALGASASGDVAALRVLLR